MTKMEENFGESFVAQEIMRRRGHNKILNFFGEWWTRLQPGDKWNVEGLSDWSPIMRGICELEAVDPASAAKKIDEFLGARLMRV